MSSIDIKTLRHSSLTTSLSHDSALENTKTIATPYQISDSPPTYAIALFDALEERIARLRQQLRTPHGDLTLQCRENLESPPAYATAVAQSLQEEGITRFSGLPPHTRTRTSPLEALPPRPSPHHESLPRAKIRPPTRQQTGSTPRDRMKLTSRKNLSSSGSSRNETPASKRLATSDSTESKARTSTTPRILPLRPR